jgi:aromatic-L-amino-acid/L-tryptophan decarboxylase
VRLWQRFLEELPDQPVARRWGPGEVAEALAIPVPAEGLDDDELFGHLHRIVFDYATHPGHPGFMGYISGAGTVPGAAAALLAAALNQNGGGFRLAPGATEIERHLMRWFASRFGLPDATAGGIVVSGGAVATLTCLAVARARRAGWDVRRLGVAAGPPLTVYASTEAHAVAARAVDVLGLGTDALRLAGVDRNGRMRVDDLGELIERDVAEGRRPLAVVATAGTTATGAIDPMPAIAELCRERSLWLHVDAAYGGAAVLSRELAHLLSGIEEADSIAFDPHKWMGVPLGAGCALLRDIDEARATFHIDASYTVEDVERSGSTFDYGSHGLQWSRGFDALKIWVSLLAHGHEGYGRSINRDVALARYLAARVEQRPEFELVLPPSLSICCFRYVPPMPTSDEDLDRLNERLMTELQLDGRTYCSNAIVDGRFVLRACIVNFRTEETHIDTLLDTAAEIGCRLSECGIDTTAPDVPRPA